MRYLVITEPPLLPGVCQLNSTFPFEYSIAIWRLSGLDGTEVVGVFETGLSLLQEQKAKIINKRNR